MKRIKLIYIGQMVLFFLFFQAMGQSYRMSVEEMWELAEKQNLDIVNAGLRIEKAEELKKSSWEPGLTNVDYTRGQINSATIDNYLHVEQELGAPFSIGANRRYFETERGLLLNEKEHVGKKTKRDLRKTYYSWVFEEQRLGIINKAIEIYDKAGDYANAQYEAGESNLLSKTLIESQLQELLIRKNQIEVNKTDYGYQLRSILNIEDEILPVDSSLKKLIIFIPQTEYTQLVDSVPDVINELEAMNLANSYFKLTKARISPTFRAGYIAQQIDKVSGFQGVQMGVSFPILFHPQKARIQAASIDQAIATNNYNYQKIKTQRMFSTLMNQYNQLAGNIDFFESNRLENALLIEKNAKLLYESGEIGYLEFVNNISVSISIQEDYWKLMNDYNQLVIDLYYFLNY